MTKAQLKLKRKLLKQKKKKNLKLKCISVLKYIIKLLGGNA